MRSFRSAWIVVLLGACLLASPAVAFNQPSVNLGFTSFLDGGPPAGPGLYLTEYLQYYTADKLAGLPISDPEVDVTVSLNQVIYQSDTEIIPGARWGLDVILPVVFIDSSPLPETDSGFGDLLVGPYLQWDPIMGAKGPLMLNRIELQTIWPTGKYDEDQALNPGSNHFSFNPYWAATVFIGPKVTASWRLHYLWNDKNEDAGPGIRYIKAGQAWHGNFAAALEVVPKTLRIGINGYFFDQLTHTEVNGASIDDDERVFAVGPGAIWHINMDMHLFLNAYKESSAENRPEGERYTLRFVWHL
ncbi:SphA family protein [Trichloromonas sp.]|uniref:SphA family protein n=1 Tax=Trichloromonas sp. TaxID=3069249 RepID=UPI003D8170C1